MTEQEFDTQVWRRFDMVTTDTGIETTVMNVCFTTRSVRIYVKNAPPEWLPCKRIEKHGMDLIKHYFTNNPHGADSRNQKIVGRSVRWNGEDHLSCCVTDGVLLGQQYGRLFVARTFITYDMCSGLQQQEFETKRKDILTDEEMYQRVRMCY